MSGSEKPLWLGVLTVAVAAMGTILAFVVVPKCTPGEQRECSCGSGKAGYQECRWDGNRFEPCVCQEVAPAQPGKKPPSQPPAKPRYLSDLDPAEINNVHGDLQKDRVYWQNEVWIAGQRFARGLGMHAPAQGVGYADYLVPKGYSRFRSQVGLARPDSNDGQNCKPGGGGDVRFQVLVNSGERFSRLVKFGDLQDIAIDGLSAGARLRLVVDNNGNSWCDHSFWANARFES
jgi:hypothetical protein